MKLSEVISTDVPIVVDLVTQLLEKGERVFLLCGFAHEELAQLSANKSGTIKFIYKNGRHKDIGIQRLEHATMEKGIRNRKTVWRLIVPQRNPEVKIEEGLKAPKEGDHPILFTLIRRWLEDDLLVKFESAGLVAMVVSISVDAVKEKPVHGQRRTYRMQYQAYTTTRRSKVPFLSAHVEDTWLYPAELEDAKVVEKTPESVFIEIPDYVNNPEQLARRK